MDTSSSDESTGSCSYDGDISVAVPDIVVPDASVTQIFTELLELKKYEDGYQVSSIHEMLGWEIWKTLLW